MSRPPQLQWPILFKTPEQKSYVQRTLKSAATLQGLTLPEYLERLCMSITGDTSAVSDRAPAAATTAQQTTAGSERSTAVRTADVNGREQKQSGTNDTAAKDTPPGTVWTWQ